MYPFQDHPTYRSPSSFLIDIETGDPDDIFALAILATHPWARLKGVTVHPGGRDQVGLVKHILKALEVDVPVGAGTPKDDRPRVSTCHYKWYGTPEPCDPDGSAVEVILDACRKNPNLQLVTGAALTNIAAAAKACEDPATFFGGGWTCQGGFVGSNILPADDVLPKFAGKVTCPTYNLGGDPRAAQYLLSPESPLWHRTRMVGKNVCHGVFWDRAIQSKVPRKAHPGLDLMLWGMGCYLQEKPEGKALHDVLATCLALHHWVGRWVNVIPYRESDGSWGCLPAPEHEARGMDEPLQGWPQALIEVKEDDWLAQLHS
jgi:inosine-uridine nucleoside N-ribohydrolase